MVGKDQTKHPREAFSCPLELTSQFCAIPPCSLLTITLPDKTDDLLIVGKLHDGVECHVARELTAYFSREEAIFNTTDLVRVERTTELGCLAN